VSVVVVVTINLMTTFERVEEWLSVFEGYIILNPGSTYDTPLCCSLIDHSKRSTGSHELHSIILFFIQNTLKFVPSKVPGRLLVWQTTLKLKCKSKLPPLKHFGKYRRF
jgi:hypothetical protein